MYKFAKEFSQEKWTCSSSTFFCYYYDQDRIGKKLWKIWESLIRENKGRKNRQDEDVEEKSIKL